MLVSHINASEQQLLATSRIPAGAGHSLHKGTPRESFIRNFLETHLSENLAIGSGEIIDCDSKPRESRNQFDIVLYKKNFPKLSFGGGISGFLAESVVATIEVKSVLDKEGLAAAIQAASNAKKLKRAISGGILIGYQPPSILSYVVAYDGPSSMDTVVGWLPAIHASIGISFPVLPPSLAARCRTTCPSVDGVYVLGHGFLQYDNMPATFISDEFRQANPSVNWSFTSTTEGSLLALFLALTLAGSGASVGNFDPVRYLASFKLKDIKVSR
jgi:hypothetical protein